MKKIKNSNFVKVIKLIYKFDNFGFVILIIDTLLSAVFPVISIFLIKFIVNKIQLGMLDRNKIIEYMLLYLLIEIIDCIRSNYMDIFRTRFDRNMERHIVNMVLKTINKLQLSDFHDSKIYDEIKRANESGTSVVGTYIMSFIDIIRNLISLCTYMVILINFNKAIVFLWL